MEVPVIPLAMRTSHYLPSSCTSEHHALFHLRNRDPLVVIGRVLGEISGCSCSTFPQLLYTWFVQQDIIVSHHRLKIPSSLFVSCICLNPADIVLQAPNLSPWCPWWRQDSLCYCPTQNAMGGRRCRGITLRPWYPIPSILSRLLSWDLELWTWEAR